MEIEFTLKAKEDVDFWKISGNKKIQNRILTLLESIKETPFKGIGKPEQLKYEWSSYWSRRITQEHRLIYEVKNDKIIIHSLKGHYD
ncbi:MAG: Txe/YoeB family addiction module toxin [Bacteroidetes bacterium]|nr:Txe/YoeB family addiction module toxin [Bacteroidota bacterium]